MSREHTKSYYRKKYREKNSEDIKQKIDKKKFIKSIKNLVCQRKLSKALSEIEHYLTEYPNDSYGLFQKGVILTSMGCLEEAETILHTIIELDLDSKYSSLYQLGVLYGLRQNLEEAEYYYRTNIESSPYPEIYSRINLSFIECEKGNFKNAELLANGYYDRKINGKFPTNIFIRFNEIPKEDIVALNLEKAQIKVNRKKIEEARSILDSIDSLENCSNSLKQKYHLLKGKIENSDKHYELAIQHLNEVLQGPKVAAYWKAKLELAKSYAKSGQPEQALHMCDEIIKRGFEFSNAALKVQGDIYQWSHQYERAKEQYLQMNNSEGIYNVAKMEFKNKNYEDALNYFNMSNLKNPALEAKNNFYKVMSLLKLGRYEEAYQTSFLVETDYLLDLFKKEFNIAILYLKVKINGYINQDNLSYTQSQIIDYDLEKAIQHINREHQKNNEIASFYDHIDIEELILNLPSLLEKEDTTIFQNLFLEIYEIPYKDLGLVNGKIADAFRVVILPDNYRVITMYPIVKEKNNSYINSSSNQKSKIKKSQIDKFNEKYNKKQL